MVSTVAASVPARSRTVFSWEISDYPHRLGAVVGIAHRAVRNSTHRPPVTGHEAWCPVVLKFWRSGPANAHMALNQSKNLRPVSGGVNPDTGCGRCRHVCCTRALQATAKVTDCKSVCECHSMPGSGPEIACNSVADIDTGVDATAAAHARRARHRQPTQGKRNRTMKKQTAFPRQPFSEGPGQLGQMNQLGAGPVLRSHTP
jgi:hypothetical protein